MKEPELPDDEDRRIFALHALQVLDTPPEERFDRITRVARRAFGVPIALISLVDRDRQWFKSSTGLEARQTPRSISFCGHALLGDTTFVVDDALQDERFHDNPLVTGEPRIRFYAGQPLYSEDGLKLGTLCILDKKPRKMSTEDLDVLRDLAALAQGELQVVDLTRLGLSIVKDRDRFRRQVLVDPLTRVWSRAAILDLLEQELARSRREHKPLALAFIDLDDFKRINDEQGHAAGDAVLLATAQRIRSGLRLYDSLARFGGDEFLALLPGTDAAQGRLIADRIRGLVAAEAVRVGERALRVTVSIGVTASSGEANADGEPGVLAKALIALADAAMLRAKRAGKDRVIVSA